VEHVAGEALTRRRPVLYGLMGALALLFLSGYPRQLAQHPLFGNRLGYRHSAFLRIKDASAHRLEHGELTPTDGGRALGFAAARARFDPEVRDKVIVTSWCHTAYLRPNAAVVHWLGLTEPFLARVDMSSDRPAHKLGLKPYAHDIADVRRTYGFRRGAFADAVADGAATPWVAAHLQVLERIEARAYNTHRVRENLSTWMHPTGRIDPDEVSASAGGAAVDR
jgi:hypothetical protein